MWIFDHYQCSVVEKVVLGLATKCIIVTLRRNLRVVPQFKPLKYLCCSHTGSCTYRPTESSLVVIMLRWQVFDTLVTPTLLYGVETWGRTLNKANHWKDLERPLVSMIARMIRSKASVPHDIIRAEMGVAPIITKAFRSVTCIQRLWELPKRRYATGWKWRHSLLVCWNATMVRVTWHEYERTTPVPI